MTHIVCSLPLCHWLTFVVLVCICLDSRFLDVSPLCRLTHGGSEDRPAPFRCHPGAASPFPAKLSSDSRSRRGTIRSRCPMTGRPGSGCRPFRHPLHLTRERHEADLPATWLPESRRMALLSPGPSFPTILHLGAKLGIPHQVWLTSRTEPRQTGFGYGGVAKTFR